MCMYSSFNTSTMKMDTNSSSIDWLIQQTGKQPNLTNITEKATKLCKLKLHKVSWNQQKNLN